MRGDRGWLRKAVGLCARSAAAYKVAFMLAGEAEIERQLLGRCRDRYELLERLLNRLSESGVAPRTMRAALNRLHTTGTHYRLADEALDEAGEADRRLAAVLSSAGCQTLADGFRTGGRSVAAVAGRAGLDATRFATGLPV